LTTIDSKSVGKLWITVFDEEKKPEVGKSRETVP
jgi:hypothetical protein